MAAPWMAASWMTAPWIAASWMADPWMAAPWMVAPSWLRLIFNLNKTLLGETGCLSNPYFLLTGYLGI